MENVSCTVFVLLINSVNLRQELLIFDTAILLWEEVQQWQKSTRQLDLFCILGNHLKKQDLYRKVHIFTVDVYKCVDYVCYSIST